MIGSPRANSAATPRTAVVSSGSGERRTAGNYSGFDFVAQCVVNDLRRLAEPAHRRTARLAADCAGVSDINDVVLTIVVHRRCRVDEAVAVSSHISPKVRAGRSRHRPQASAGDMGVAIVCERFAP
jgi:hypothetical protein